MNTNGTKAAVNGTAAKVETSVTVAKPETPVKALPAAKPQPDLIPLDDRLHKLDQLFELQGKYNKLKASLQKLQDFKLKKDSESSTLRLSDDNRNSFETSNAEVIAIVIATLQQATAEKIKQLEPKLTW